MRSWSRWAGIAIMLVWIGGCAAQVDPGSAGAGLTDVRKADYSNQTMYIDLTISSRPLTADEIGDATFATPVRIRFYDEWAVAWYAPDGIALAGHPENAVRAWRVYDNREAIDSDELAPGSGAEPPPSYVVARPGTISAETGFRAEPGVVAQSVTPPDQRNHLPVARLDWLGDYMRDWNEIPPGFHPGCF